MSEVVEEAATERQVEAILFAASAPVTLEDLRRRLPDVDVAAALARLGRRFEGRGIELHQVAGGWRFATAADLAPLVADPSEAPRRLSRAAMETLAVIAYHQPVTRAEIDAVRGVGLSRGTLDALLEVGWVRPRGRRRSPGRPTTYATTDAFLRHFGLRALGDLPALPDYRAAGLLSLDLPRSFAIPQPTDAPAPDEDPPQEGEEPEFVQDFVGAESA